MKKFSFFVILPFVLISTLQAQWQQIQTTPLLTNGYCIEAIGNDFAVISSYLNKILITTDKGLTWTQKSFPNNRAVDISLVNENVFYIAADDGTFYKTTDGGDSWITIYSNPQKTGFGNYIEMFSPTDGIAMGDANYFTKIPLFLKTTDGINWFETCNQTIGGGAADGWLSLDFVNSSVGYYSPKGGPAPRKLWKTIDGGINWIETNFDVYADVLKFYDKNFGLLAHAPDVYRTTNGGLSWQSFLIGFPNNYHSQDIEFVPDNPNKIWMSYSNGLLFSGDSGKTWTEQIIPNLTGAFDIKFANEKTGWLLCTNGKLFYTNNNGGIISSAPNENIPSGFSLFQNYPNPFNPETTIRYQISEFSFVTLKVYDLLGREITTLVNEYQKAGIHNSQFSTSPTGRQVLNYSLPSGTYFYRLTAGDYSSTQKMILLK